MARKPTTKPDDPEQAKRFVDTALEHGADETEAGADKIFRKIVKPPKPVKNQGR
jgi:hypothetical protein